VFEAVRHVNLRVDRGRFTSVIGLSGCGKSTLLRIVGGLIEPTAGSVAIDGLPAKAAQHQKSIGFVFQDAALLPWLTVVENVEVSLRVNRKANRVRPRGTDELLNLVGLLQFRNAFPYQLSGGRPSSWPMPPSFVALSSRVNRWAPWKRSQSFRIVRSVSREDGTAGSSSTSGQRSSPSSSLP